MRIKIVEFEGDKYALIQEQNDWTGNYIVALRKVRGEYGEEFVRHNGNRISVKFEVKKERDSEIHINDALKFFREYGRGRV